MTPAAQFVDRARHFLLHDLWSSELQPRSVTAAALRLLQFVIMVGQSFVKDRLLLRASALTYMALLSMIPLLAVALSILKAVGVSEDLASLAVDEIAAGSPEAKRYILELV